MQGHALTKILIAVSEPRDAPWLRVATEVREIQESRSKAKRRRQFRILQSCRRSRPDLATSLPFS
jgi:hypothetical protein